VVGGKEDEVGRLQKDLERWKREAGDARELLEDSKEGEEETTGMLKRRQADVENLREQLVGKDKEIVRLLGALETLKVNFNGAIHQATSSTRGAA
jgi:predicted  nucleic acid-binding Zn-ribbon protein